MTPRRFALLLALASSPGCAAPDAPPAAGDVAGCWLLEWHHGDTVYAAHGLPDSVHLDSALIPGTRDHRRVAFAGLSVPSDTLGPGDTLPWYRHYHANHWRMGSGDSVDVVFNDNSTRYETALQVRGGELWGTAVFRTHEKPERLPVVSVRGQRFPCPAAS